VVYEFDERTIKVVIDQSRCDDCMTKACVKACSLYSRGILTVRNRLPTLRTGTDAVREGTECLACEEACRLRGFNMIRIEAPIQGLNEYKRAHGG
jgi:polyferredoxin